MVVPLVEAVADAVAVEAVAAAEAPSWRTLPHPWCSNLRRLLVVLPLQPTCRFLLVVLLHRPVRLFLLVVLLRRPVRLFLLVVLLRRPVCPNLPVVLHSLLAALRRSAALLVKVASSLPLAALPGKVAPLMLAAFRGKVAFPLPRLKVALRRVRVRRLLFLRANPLCCSLLLICCSSTSPTNFLVSRSASTPTPST